MNINKIGISRPLILLTYIYTRSPFAEETPPRKGIILSYVRACLDSPAASRVGMLYSSAFPTHSVLLFYVVFLQGEVDNRNPLLTRRDHHLVPEPMGLT